MNKTDEQIHFENECLKYMNKCKLFIVPVECYMAGMGADILKRINIKYKECALFRQSFS